LVNYFSRQHGDPNDWQINLEFVIRRGRTSTRISWIFRHWAHSHWIL